MSTGVTIAIVAGIVVALFFAVFIVWATRKNKRRNLQVDSSKFFEIRRTHK